MRILLSNFAVSIGENPLFKKKLKYLAGCLIFSSRYRYQNMPWIIHHIFFKQHMVTSGLSFSLLSSG